MDTLIKDKLARKSVDVQLSKAVVDGEKTVRAVVTAPTLDRDYDIVDTPSLRLPLKGGGFVYARDLQGNEDLDIPFLIDHDFSVRNVIGSVREAYINGAGELEVIFGVSSLKEAQDMFTLLEEGHLSNAFSITFADYEYADGKIYDGEILEISLVFRGSNKNARLLAVSKSLIKERTMAEAKEKSPELKEKYAKLELIKKEIEEAEAAETEEVETAPVETGDETEATPVEESETEEEAEAETEAEEEVEEEAEEVEEVKEEEEKPMTEVESKAVARKQAGAGLSEVEAAPAVKTKVDQNAHKVLVVKQIAAWSNKQWDVLKELNSEAKKLDEAYGISSKAVDVKSKALSYTEGEPLYLCEQFDRDVEKCYGDYGNLGTLVRRVTLTTSPKLRFVVKDGEIDFQPVGWAGVKPEDETGWSSVSAEPKPFAVIQVWNDHVEEDSAIALYDELVENVAEARARLEDRLIATFETITTTDGTVYPTQGIIPQIEAGAIDYDPSDGEATFAAFLAAMSAIRSCDRGNLTVAFNSAKIFELAGLRNNNGDLVFPNSGNTLNLGLAGQIRFVTSDEIPATDILVGNFNRYRLVDKGGLKLTTNNLGLVGELNLFQTDHTALRAVVRYEGVISEPSLEGAFALLRSPASS